MASTTRIGTKPPTNAAARPIPGPVEDRPRKRRGRPAAGTDDVGREALLTITRDLLRTTPPETVTRLMIAERAHVDPGLIRYYFRTVAHLIAEVAIESHLRIRESVLAIVATRDPAQALKTRIGLLVDLFIEFPFHHRLIRQVMYGPDGKNEHAAWLVSLRSAVDQTGELVAIGLQEGVFRDVDPRMLQLVLIGVAEFFGSNPEIVGDVFEGAGDIASRRDEYVDFLAQLLLDGLRPRG